MSNEISAEYIKAQELDRKIKASVYLAQQSLYEICIGFTEMRDSKLYKELGYQNFDEYCENETGFTRRQVYKYITLAEKLSPDFVNSSSQIGVTKLALLTALSEEERTEITETTNLEETSVKELKEKISDLKNANKMLADKINEEQEKARQSRESESKACRKLSVLETDAEFYRQKIQSLEAEVKNKNEDITALEDNIRELESRPIDVAFSDSHEIENLKKAMQTCDDRWAAQYQELEENTITEKRELHKSYKAEIEKLKAEHEQKLAEVSKTVSTEPVPDMKETFKAYYSMAYNSFNTMMGFVKKQSETDRQFCLEKTASLIDIFRQAQEG